MATYPNFDGDTPEFGPDWTEWQDAYIASEWRMRPSNGSRVWEPDSVAAGKPDTTIVCNAGNVIEKPVPQAVASALVLAHNKMLYDALVAALKSE